MLNRMSLIAVLMLTFPLVLAAQTAPAPTAVVSPAVSPAPPAATLRVDAPEGAVVTTASGPAGAEDRQPAVEPPPNFFQKYGLMVVLMGGLVLMYLWMGRSRKKQESKRRQMLESLGKGDKVVTIGGVVGTVIEVKPNEVTVKVDETNNVRMKFARWAIRQVGEGPKGDSEEPSKK